MTRRFAGFAVCFVMLLMTMTAGAASLTTIFDTNNGGAFGGAVYFDVAIGSQDLTVTGFDTNTEETVAFTMSVYLTAAGSTAFGNETDSGAWNLVATGSGIGAGTNLPSAITLSNSFALLANSTYGIALVMGPTAGHDYTNGTGSNQIYSNADLTITTGTASNVPFEGGVFNPRVWNGTIVYSADASEPQIPEPSTLSMLFLAGGLAMLAARRRKAAAVKS